MSSRNILVAILTVVIIIIVYVSTNNSPQLSLNVDVISSGEDLTITINNRSWNTIYFGQKYEIQRYTDNKWETIHIPDGWEDIAYSLKPRKKFEQVILFVPSEPGQYRILKEVLSDLSDEETAKLIITEFTVSK
ncbi:hypothetical protein HYG86_05755 [Alkalicella caledoniensis]|uniref:Bacterial Ig-like domain-containing protein n=1 Tax=Alkalicella caledoniensis TaxID=2731377 RepID=A0A7G9W6K0_ALKCA|nr:immunoglobulin-like domain-containing protein [Alkalicella caledoniensis]QNO14312.1 hypothetical protein HYG86_05755 [Alkalicella caledoniensis]